MNCPYCGYTSTRVIDKRDNNESNEIRRRRACLSCNKRFTTYERISEIGLIIVKRDGSKEKFSREKLKTSIYKAINKNDTNPSVVDSIADDIEMDILNMSSREVHSSIIGKMVLTKLKELDEMAYIRYASVYKNFSNINDLISEIKYLEK